MKNLIKLYTSLLIIVSLTSCVPKIDSTPLSSKKKSDSKQGSSDEPPPSRQGASTDSSQEREQDQELEGENIDIQNESFLSCGNISHGGKQFRTRYQQTSVPSDQSCISELQSRTCENGRWSNYSGSYQFQSCEELAAQNNSQVLGSLGENELSFALAKPKLRYYAKSDGQRISNTAWDGASAVAIALAGYNGNTTVDQRIIDQANYSVSGNNAPFFEGGYYAQHERNLTTFLVIIKNTPRLYDQLSASVKMKIDLLMQASLIASVFTTSDKSYYIRNEMQQRDLVGGTNLNRGWNPNFREGMIGGVTTAIAYYGGHTEVMQFLNSYNHNDFTDRLENAGLSNPYATFSAARSGDPDAPTASRINDSVKNYAYYGHDLSEWKSIYTKMALNTYNKNVSCGLNNGSGVNDAGRIIDTSDCVDLPNKGENGMLTEFDSVDANGKRSAVVYALDGHKTSQNNQIALIVSGLWDKTDPQLQELVSRMKIGASDLDYKLQVGYIDYHKGRARGTWSYDNDEGKHGLPYTIGLWKQVLIPYHQ